MSERNNPNRKPPQKKTERSDARRPDQKNRSSQNGKSANSVVFYDNTQNSTVNTNRPPQIQAQNKERVKKVGRSYTPQKAGKLPVYRVVLNVFFSFIGALFILAGCVLFIVYTDFHRIDYQEIDAEPDDIPAEELVEDDMVLNVMLFGEDTRENASTGQSDTMVLMSIDARHKKIKMLSLLRDTYVDIPGYGENRLNAAYSLGGASLTVKTIQSNYGIKIDKYAVVNFSGFRKIIEALGGIDIELTPDEIDYINWQFWINAQPDYKNNTGDYREVVRENLRYVWLTSVGEDEMPIKKSELDFKVNSSGEVTAKVRLNGREALWHARNRGEDGICSGDDFVRTQRQRDVIGVIINQLKNSDLATIQSVIYEIGPLITTNLKTSQILSLASRADTYLKYKIVSESAPNLDEYGSSFTFSGDDHPVYINGYLSSVILVNDWSEFRRQIWDFLYEEQVMAD